MGFVILGIVIVICILALKGVFDNIIIDGESMFTFTVILAIILVLVNIILIVYA